MIQGLSASGAAQAGGTKLTIEGANFTADTNVNFGNTPATSKTFISETKMDVLVPANSVLGNVDIILSNARGSSTASAQSKFEYIKVDEFTLPNNPIGLNMPQRLHADSQGRLWFLHDAKIGFITNTGQFTFFSLPAIAGFWGTSVQGVNDMEYGNNVMWLIYGEKLTKVTDTGVFSFYDIPGAALGDSHRFDVAVGHDGAIWVSNQGKNTILRYDTNGNLVNTLTATVNVANLIRGSNQNMWFIARNSFGYTGQLGRISATGQIDVFTPTSPANASSLSVQNLLSNTMDVFFFGSYSMANTGYVRGFIGEIQATMSTSILSSEVPTMNNIILDANNNFWYTRQNLGAIFSENIVVKRSPSQVEKAYLVAPRANPNFYEDVNQIASTSEFIWFTRSNVNKIGVISLNP
jgi:streptogramin lyase